MIVKPSKKLFISAIVLLVVGAVLVLAAYAWVVLSTRPSVEGMSVNIGSNGGLEIALLSDATYQNTDLILTSVGDSSEIRAVEEANLSWGNVLDLSSEAYGLRHIKLLPTILIADSGANGTVKLGDGILRIPTFGADGRIAALDENALSGVYRDGSFRCSAGGEPHGVRAIGTAGRTTDRQRAMILAHSGITTAQTMARQTAATALQENGSVLFNIPARYARDPAAVYTDADRAALLALTDAAETSLGYLDSALRDAAISVLAAQITDQSQFESASALLKDERIPLSRVFSSLPAVLSGSFSTWADRLAQYSREMSAVRSACEALEGGVYTYEMIAPIAARFVDVSQVYSGETLYDPKRPVPDGSQLTLMPGSGVFSGIADFTGSYSAYAKRWEDLAENAEVELHARTAETTPWLSMLAAVSMNLDAAGDGTYSFKLDDIYGYVIDMAFRTNIEGANLLLQTQAVQRIYADATLPDTQGAGSYIELYSSGLSYDRLVELLDAIRVSFTDGGGTLLAMAKTNTSNIERYNEGYRAPLYLYDYTAANGSVVMGGRRDAQGKITALPQNTPKIVSAVVWLDGEAVSNSMASFFGGSLTGALNLQFSLDRQLTPAENGDLHNADWTPVVNNSHMLYQISALRELPDADQAWTLALFADRAEAVAAGYDIPEDYAVIVRDGLPCFRVYTGAETVTDRITGKAATVPLYVLTGYDGDTLSLPPDSSGLFAGLGNLTVIENVEKLRAETAGNTDELFRGCYYLTAVNEILPKLTRIGSYAFENCAGLRGDAVIPEGNTSIGEGAFAGVSLSSVTLPESLTSIGSRAFESCKSLSFVAIPNHAISIGEYAFNGCPAEIIRY